MTESGGKVRIQAHRGVSTECPENTFAAFRAAVRQGYDQIELDPKFTKDNRCVILHDDSINRTARNADGSEISQDIPISSLSLADAEKYDFGLWKSEAFRGEKIPRLEETLCFSRKYQIPLKFDNIMESFTQDQLAAFFAEVRKAGVASGIGFTCRTIGYMCRVAQAFPDAEIHYDGPVGADILRALRAGLHGNRLTVWVGFAAATPELCALVKRYAALGLWILHSEDQRQKAVESFHADIIETNGEIKPGRAI